MTNKPHWQVEALIAAWRLPDQPTALFGCVIEALPQSRSTPKASGHLELQPAGGTAVGYLTLAPDIQFRAHHAIHTEVSADTDSEAMALAESRFAQVLGALSLATEPELGPPLIKVTHIARVPAGPRPGDPITLQEIQPTSGQLGGVVVNPLDDQIRLRLGGLEHMAGRDKACAELIRLWAQAEAEHRFTFTAADLQQTLMDYTKVLEHVASALAPGFKRNTPEALADIAARCRKKLAVSKSPERDLRIIEAAAAEARKLRLDAVAERIRQAATQLGLGPQDRRAVSEVWRMRSAKAGHPSTAGVTDDDIMFARRAVGHLARRYLDRTLLTVLTEAAADINQAK